MRGASPCDVAKVLGDKIETVEKHYTPFVKELRERVRSILENGIGLESSVTPVSQSPGEIRLCLTPGAHGLRPVGERQ